MGPGGSPDEHPKLTYMFYTTHWAFFFNQHTYAVMIKVLEM